MITTVSVKRDTQQQQQREHLPWPPWAAQQKIERSYLCLAATDLYQYRSVLAAQGGQGKVRQWRAQTLWWREIADGFAKAVFPLATF